MRSIVARNVSEALYLAKQAIDIEGVEVDTRNGKALEFPTPVMTTYKVSTERVHLFNADGTPRTEEVIKDDREHSHWYDRNTLWLVSRGK